uniref:RING-type domain-containing protein n=1 Tax=Panagrolaimus sp. ES5 TaxID=591445 RepID=A0AC34FTF1_9BILA
MLSIRYVTLEKEESDPELKLDDLVKLERHGFHFLAQLMLALFQSCILSIESDAGRVSLAVFTVPIIARMCGCPNDKLIIPHNVACAIAMFIICIYVLNHVPTFLQSIKQGSRRLRALFVIRGIGIGIIKIWQRLRLAEVLAICWMLMFSLRFYNQVATGAGSIDLACMSAIAETTSSPFSLLALALTVSYISQFIVQCTQFILGSALNSNHVLATHGYTEALTLVFLCLQAGVLGMRTEQKMFMLKLVLFIVATGAGSIDLACMSAIAETTSSPFSLLALALTVSYISQFIVQCTQFILGSALNSNHVLATHGYTEALTLVFLCLQAGVLGMRTEQKMFMLKLVLFIVLSALLQSLYEILEPQMLAFAALTNVTVSMHIRSLVLATILMITPFLISFMLMTFLPMDLWFVMIISNCLLTSIRTISTTVIYFLKIAENKSEQPWERCDDLIFYCKISTHVAELLLALFVVVYGIFALLVLGKWTVFSVIVLIFHSYFNVLRKLQSSINAVRTRKAASDKINEFTRPTKEQLDQKSDVCMICLGEMSTDARVTPCNHYFHGFCLKKWLFVKPVCPLCYVSLGDGTKLQQEEQPRSFFPRRRPRDQQQQQQNEFRRMLLNYDSPRTVSASLQPLLQDENGVDLDNLPQNESTAHRLRMMSTFTPRTVSASLQPLLQDENGVDLDNLPQNESSAHRLRMM